MATPLRLLILEDRQADLELMLHELRRAEFEPSWKWAVDEREYLSYLDPSLDVILADYTLPQFDAWRALELLQERGLDVPFIVVTGTVGEELAVECMKRGASDYLLKDRLARLGQAVKHALAEKRDREERRRAEHALLESEKRHRALIEQSSDGIALVDRHGSVVYASPSTQSVLGYADDELVGRDFCELVHPDDCRHLPFGLTDIAREPTRATVVTYRARHRDGTWRWIEAVTRNLLDEPSVRAIVVNYRDVSERKQAEEQRAEVIREQAARAEAELAVRRRDEFLSIASHELKTPMTSLRGFVQLALRELDRDGSADHSRLQRALQIIDLQSRRMVRHVSQLLDLSRLDSGKLMLDRRATDLSDIVEDVVAGARAISHQCSISVRAPASLPAEVDSLRIEQVVTNLVDNALKFSPVGSQIDVEVLVLGDDLARISVTDRGIGIPPERRSRIFERFYQGHPEIRAPGMGLGLYISREIVELHGGRLEAEFPDEGGSRFVVTLPTVASPMLAHALSAT